MPLARSGFCSCQRTALKADVSGCFQVDNKFQQSLLFKKLYRQNCFSLRFPSEAAQLPGTALFGAGSRRAKGEAQPRVSQPRAAAFPAGSGTSVLRGTRAADWGRSALLPERHWIYSCHRAGRSSVCTL